MPLPQLGVEIPLLLFYTAYSLSGPLTTNFVIYRTCNVIMNFNETDCAKLGLSSADNATKELERLVEPRANYILMTLNLVSAVGPVCVSLFIGPWSDVFGRKAIMIVNICGMLIAFAMQIAISLLVVSPWFLLLEAIPNILSGGVPTFITMSICHLTDTSTPNSRGIRMGIFVGLIYTGDLIGNLLSSSFLRVFRYSGTFIFCGVLDLVALFYVIFILKETVIRNENDSQSFFTFSHVKTMFKLTFKPRIGLNRFVCLATILALIVGLVAESNETVMTLLLRSKFGWSLADCTVYSGIRSIARITGTFFGVYVLHTIMGFTECPLILLGLTSSVCFSFLVLIANTDELIYAALAFKILDSLVTAMMRSFLSKLIPHDEIGKVFSLVVALEFLAVIAMDPVYTLVYNNTIKTFPSAFALISFSCYIWNILIFLTIFFINRKPNRLMYVELVDDNVSGI